MWELIIAFIVGAIIPIITQYIEYMKLKSEEKRWYGEYFLKLKVNTIKNLQSVMEECFFIYNKYLNLSPIPLNDYYTYVAGKSEDYRNAKVMAEIYLTETQNRILSNMLGKFREADNAIKRCSQQNITINKLQNPPFNFGAFVETHVDAVDVFRELLNPRSLREYIRNL